MDKQTSSKKERKKAQLIVIPSVPSSGLTSDGACPVDDSAFGKNTLSNSPVKAVEIVTDAQFIFSLSLYVVARRAVISQRGLLVFTHSWSEKV